MNFDFEFSEKGIGGIFFFVCRDLMSLYLMMGMALAVLMISVCRVIDFNFIISGNQDKDYHRLS